MKKIKQLKDEECHCVQEFNSEQQARHWTQLQDDNYQQICKYIAEYKPVSRNSLSEEEAQTISELNMLQNSTRGIIIQ